jgi:hypothetical protein
MCFEITICNQFKSCLWKSLLSIEKGATDPGVSSADDNRSEKGNLRDFGGEVIERNGRASRR